MHSHGCYDPSIIADWVGRIACRERTAASHSKNRRVDLSDALIHELEILKRKRQTEYLAKGKNEIPEWVFLGPGRILWKDGKPIGHEEGQRVEMYNIKNRYFLKCLEKAKPRRIRFHDLRHTFASLLIQNGESLAYVKDQLGHVSIKMTVDVYGHLVPGANREAVNRLPTAEGTESEYGQTDSAGEAVSPSRVVVVQ